MKTNSIITPRHSTFVYFQNEKRPDIYDLQGNVKKSIFNYFRLSQPFAPFLIKQGARLVIESWEGKEKKIFTGLIPVADFENWYYGDLIVNDPNKKRKKSFVLFHLEGKTATLFVFGRFTLYPAKRLPFCRNFITQRQ